MMSRLPIGHGWGRVDRAARSIGGRNGLLVATFDAAAKSDHFGRFSTQTLLPTATTLLPNDLTLISLIVAGIIQSPSGLHVQSLRLNWKTLLWPCPFIVRWMSSLGTGRPAAAGQRSHKATTIRHRHRRCISVTDTACLSDVADGCYHCYCCY